MNVDGFRMFKYLQDDHHTGLLDAMRKAEKARDGSSSGSPLVLQYEADLMSHAARRASARRLWSYLGIKPPPHAAPSAFAAWDGISAGATVPSNCAANAAEFERQLGARERMSVMCRPPRIGPCTTAGPARRGDETRE